MERCRKVKVFSDGASRGNPGPAAIAYIIYDESGSCIESGARLIGRATNNEAEYQALVLAMTRALAICSDSALFFLDSELLVKQFNGQYRARDPRMRDYLEQAQTIARGFREIRVTHVPRENPGAKTVDGMVNEALDRAR